MVAQGVDLAGPSAKENKPRPMGSRRIFPPMFKLQVLDSYRRDNDCKGNQRATARKFGIHRRQIQKWLQSEANLRSVVAESMRHEGENGCRSGPVDSAGSVERRAPRVFKHDARTLKLVAQKLYPSSYGGMLKDSSPVPFDSKGEQKTSQDYFVPKKYQLNDTRSEASAVRSVGEGVPVRKPSINGSVMDLNLKDDVSGLKLCGSELDSNPLIQKYSGSPGQELSSRVESSSLGVAPPSSITGMPGGLVYPNLTNPPVLTPSHPLPPLHLHHRYSPTQPTSILPSVSLFKTDSALPPEEPYNLIKQSPQPPESNHPAVLPECARGTDVVSPTAVTQSPAPRIGEIISESKTSAFSPKRKWLQDSIQDKLVPEPVTVLPLKQRVKVSPPPEEPKLKRPCPDFSIERLCGSPSVSVKSESRTPLSLPASPSPSIFSTSYALPPPLVFPPLMAPLHPHRNIPDLSSLHFKPEVTSSLNSVVKPELNFDHSSEASIKEESLSGDDETIDVLSTTPVENKSFDFSGMTGVKRRSFSVQFKLSVLDAFYNDQDCNKNQRATARKFNINRRQVQKWLSLEPELRNEGCRKKQFAGVGNDELCAQCPQHCREQQSLALHVRPLVGPTCILSDLKHEGVQSLPFLYGNVMAWPHPSALPFPAIPFPRNIPWYHQYGEKSFC